MGEPDKQGLVTGLLRRSHLLAPVDLAPAVADAAADAGLDEVVLYVTDYGQERLVPLTVSAADAALREHPARTAVAIDGSLPGRAFCRGEVVEAELRGRHRIFVPVLCGMERLGVLEAAVDGTSAQRALLEDVASLVAQLLISKGLHSDYLERAPARADVPGRGDAVGTAAAAHVR
jgi:hypothetical protein